MTKGYMVFVEQGHAPSRVHGVCFEAFLEAQRLAAEHPGKVVTVLEIKQQMIGKVLVEEI